MGWGPKAWPSTSYGYLAPFRDSIPIVQERTLGTWHDRDINKAATRERVMHMHNSTPCSWQHQCLTAQLCTMIATTHQPPMRKSPERRLAGWNVRSANQPT